MVYLGMANPNIGNEGKKYQFKKGHKAQKRTIAPEELARVLDLALWKELRRCIRECEPIPPQIVSAAVNRVEDLGQTKEPEKVPENDPKGDDIQASISEALAGRARTSPPADGGVKEPPGSV